MPKQLHPSDSIEQQLPHKKILSLLNEKYQLNLESRKVIKKAYFCGFHHILNNILINKLTFVNL